MPPKAQKEGSKKKVVEDKTFGLKNKNKSAKVQNQVKQLQMESSMKGRNPEEIARQKAAEDKKMLKLAEVNKKKEEALLFNATIIQPKLAFGQDPKTVMCAFHKAGICEKGAKCKYSHDKNVERKVQKVNVYEDIREAEGSGGNKKEDTMDKWDEEKLRNVVTSKTGNPRTTTDIVCKFFIQAIEDQKYGWFWECPNGVDCKYRHALPPGFVLKSEKKALEEAQKKEVISLEEFLETERHKLVPPLTPCTPETFAKWKKTRMDKRQAELEAKDKAKANQRAAGKLTGMSGRDLFVFSADSLGADEEDDEDEWDLQRYLAGRDQDERPPSEFGSESDSESESDADDLADQVLDGDEEAEAKGASSVTGRAKDKEKGGVDVEVVHGNGDVLEDVDGVARKVAEVDVGGA